MPKERAKYEHACPTISAVVTFSPPLFMCSRVVHHYIISASRYIRALPPKLVYKSLCAKRIIRRDLSEVSYDPLIGNLVQKHYISDSGHNTDWKCLKSCPAKRSGLGSSGASSTSQSCRCSPKNLSGDTD